MSLLFVSSLEPEWKKPTSRKIEMNWIMFCMYRTSPYSVGGRKRVLTIEDSSPRATPIRELPYRSAICFFAWLN
jgi:hypothetical protein